MVPSTNEDIYLSKESPGLHVLKRVRQNMSHPFNSHLETRLAISQPWGKQESRRLPSYQIPLRTVDEALHNVRRKRQLLHFHLSYFNTRFTICWSAFHRRIGMRSSCEEYRLLARRGHLDTLDNIITCMIRSGRILFTYTQMRRNTVRRRCYVTNSVAH